MIALQQRGDRVITERELRQAAVLRLQELGFATTIHGGKVRKFIDGSRVPNTLEGNAAWLNDWTPKHMPDLCIEPPGPGRRRWAVEVELNSKATHLIDEKLHWYRKQASQFNGVVYCCDSPAVARSVQRAADRTHATDIVHIHVLPPSFLARAIHA